MPTTSVKLPDELKRRAASIAKKRGMTMHAFLVSAIEEITAAEEARERLFNVARKALADTRRSGSGYAAEDVHAYLRDRVAERKSSRPKAKSWRD